VNHEDRERPARKINYLAINYSAMLDSEPFLLVNWHTPGVIVGRGVR
jgi:hypothetical protein